MFVHDLGINAEPVDKSLSADLPDDSLVVVVPQRTAELVVAHVGLILVMPPPHCDGVRFQQSKLPLFCCVRPLNEIAVLSILVIEHRVQKLPQLHATLS